MGVVKYIGKGIGKTYNLNQAVKDGFGIKWKGEDALVGLKLEDRKKPKHKAEIISYDWFMGTLRVFFKDGGWLCFDHCIEQFKLSKK